LRLHRGHEKEERCGCRETRGVHREGRENILAPEKWSWGKNYQRETLTLPMSKKSPRPPKKGGKKIKNPYVGKRQKSFWWKTVGEK